MSQEGKEENKSFPEPSPPADLVLDLKIGHMPSPTHKGESEGLGKWVFGKGKWNGLAWISAVLIYLWRQARDQVNNQQGFTFLLLMLAVAAAKSLQSCPALCNPIDGSPPGSPIPGILQARTLEWVAISFSNAWKWKVKVKLFSHVRLFETPWATAHQAPPSMGFSRQEYWSGVPLP